MLQKLRDQTQGTGFRVITVLLIFALVVGLGAANFFATTSSDVAEVGGQLHTRVFGQRGAAEQQQGSGTNQVFEHGLTPWSEGGKACLGRLCRCCYAAAVDLAQEIQQQRVESVGLVNRGSVP